MAARTPTPELYEAHWPADESTDLVDFTVGTLLALRASENPDGLAVVGVEHGDGRECRLTYAHLHDRAMRVATALRGLAEPGSHVALWAPNVVEWPIVQYGAALAGMVLVALNPALREQELEYALTHSGAVVLIHADEHRGQSLTAIVEEVTPRVPGLRCISMSDREVWQAAEADSDVARQAPTDPDAVVMLQYTSGTTGNPKGVLLKHRSLINVAKLTLETAGVPDGAVCLNPLPMFHTAGCVVATLGPLWLGGTVILVERFRPAPVMNALSAEGVSVLFHVPTILGALLEYQRGATERASRLQVVMGGAAHVPPSMIEEAENVFGASVVNLFGQTELAPVLSATRPSDSRADQLATVGQPLPQVECKIVDPSTNATLGVGQPGEICARGYQQFLGYLHDADATEQAVDADGFVHTGDLGALDARGYLTVTGRLKELIIRGGENISPTEVEGVLGGAEGVAEACVVGLADDRWGEIVAAAIRPRGDADEATKNDLAAYVAGRLASFKVPQRWFVIDELPLTATGKVRRFEVREAIVEGRLREL